MKAMEPLMPEDHEASLLAAYDEALAAGLPTTIDEQSLAALGPESAARLREDLASLELLQALWPRSRGRRGHGPLPDEPVADVPAQLGRFRVLCKLGQGGHGIVFLAFDPLLKRQVALKVPRLEMLLTREMRQRFLREAQAAAGLDHPGIVPVYEAGETDSICYIVSAYCPSNSLAEWLQQQQEPVTLRTAAALAAHLARALAYIHSRGILHRDLKPSNVLLATQTENEEGQRHPDLPFLPKLTDFGLARSLDQENGLTRTGDLVGTPSYMAPEQTDGRSERITSATDVHGLGAILYTLLTGRPPFIAPTMLQTLEQVRNNDPIPPRRLNRRVDRDLETICLKCLAKDPRRRYASAEALAEDLERWLDHRPIQARPSTRQERLAKWARRRPSAAALVLVSTLAVLAALTGSLWHNLVLHQVLNDRERALEESDLLRKQGLEREGRLLDHLYLTDMRLALEMWYGGDLTRLEELLNRHQPGEEGDRRGFEWHWLWRLAHPEKAALRAHDSGLLCAAVSPDDRYLVTGDRQGNVRIWDLETLKRVASLTGHTDEVQRAVFSCDGRTLATCSKDRSIRLWDVATWKQTKCLSGPHEMSVMSVAFSPNGSLLASCDRNHRLALWELPSGRLLRTWQGHVDVVHEVRFAPDGRTLFSVSQEGCVRAWNVADGREQAIFTHEQKGLLRLSISPDGQKLATAGYSHTIFLWRPESSEEPVELSVPNQIRSLAFSTQGVLAAVGDDGLLSVWTLRPGNKPVRDQRVLHITNGILREVAFAHRGATLVTAAEEGTVKLWDLSRLLGWEQVATSPTVISYLAVSPEGRMAAWCTENKCVLWDLIAQKLRWTKEMPGNLESVAFAPSGRAVVTANPEGVYVFDTATGRPLLERRAALIKASFLNAAFSPSEELLATSHGDGTIRLWDYPSGKLRGGFQAHAKASFRLAFSRDGRTLVVSSMDHSISLWDIGTFECRAVLRGHTDRPESFVLSSDDSTLISGCLQGVIKTWDLASGRERQTLSHSGYPISRMTISPNDRTLATTAADRLSGADPLRLWHMPTGQDLFPMMPSGLRFMCAAFSPDGQTLLAGTKPTKEGELGSVLMYRSKPQ